MLRKLLIPALLMYAVSGQAQGLSEEALKYMKDVPVEEQFHTKGIEVENNFGYNADDEAYERFGALKEFVRNNKSMTSEQISVFEKIAADDGNFKVRDFADYIAEKYCCEKIIEGYSFSDNDDNRLEALENFVWNKKYVNDQSLRCLEIIAAEDAYCRDLAATMVVSYEFEGDFSETEPHQEMLVEKEIIEALIKEYCSFDDKRGVLLDLIKSNKRLHKLIIDDLPNLYQKEDDQRNKDLITEMIGSYVINGDFSGVELE